MIFIKGSPLPLHSCPRAAPGCSAPRGRDIPVPSFFLLTEVECELWPRLGVGVGGVPASPGLVKGQGRGPLGVPTPASHSKELAGSRYGGVLLLVTGPGEGDKSSLGPESKCLKGAWGTEVEKGKCAEGDEAPGCRPRPSSKWGDGCRSRFQL